MSVLHGHSAHIFQGVEVYQNKLILYDTGDFVDDYYVDPFLRNDYSFLFIVEADKTGIRSLRMTPTRIMNFQVNCAKGKDAQKIKNRMKQLSAEFKTVLLEEENREDLIWRP